jgi:hypothetical protein
MKSKQFIARLQVISKDVVEEKKKHKTILEINKMKLFEEEKKYKEKRNNF